MSVPDIAYSGRVKGVLKAEPRSVSVPDMARSGPIVVVSGPDAQRACIAQDNARHMSGTSVWQYCVPRTSRKSRRKCIGR
eukprot:2682151-Rhodomonas_salina.2